MCQCYEKFNERVREIQNDTLYCNFKRFNRIYNAKLNADVLFADIFLYKRKTIDSVF